MVFVVALAGLWRPLELIERGRGWPWLRSRRLLPRFWLTIAALAFIGGLIHTPNNYDYLTYRFPRLLSWSWEQKWFWIPTVNDRMNISATQFEWTMAPLFILFKTDRLFFLINFIAYLFLPGLVFSVFRGLGISGRISWWWMWVLPCGYCFVLQAASTGNDSFAAVFLLAALHYLFRARVTGSMKNVVLSTLAIALLTGAKASNLPLTLPWAALLFFVRGPALAKVTPLVVAATLLVAVVVSYLPTAVLNRAYTGDFFGDPTNSGRMKVEEPIGGIVGNVLEIGWQNVAPPLWYKEISLNEDVPTFLWPMLARSFPRFDLNSREFPGEEGAGIGLGCTAAAALFLALGLWARGAGRGPVTSPRRAEALWVAGAVVVAALVYMAKIGTEAAARVVTPYYPLVIAGVLVMAALDGRVVRWRFWRSVGFLVMLSAVPMLVLSPSRPLFPATAVASLIAQHGSPGLSNRFAEVYLAYARRSFDFEEITALVPPEERVLGFLQTGDSSEVSLWRPFGSRQVVDITPKDSAAEIKARGIRLIVVSGDSLIWDYHTDIAPMLEQWSAHIVAKKNIELKAQGRGFTWYLIRMD